MCRSFSNFYIITSIYYLVNDFLYVYIAYLSLYLINYKAAASFFYIMSLFLASLFIAICYYMYLFLSITDKRSFYLQVRVANTATLNSLFSLFQTKKAIVFTQYDRLYKYSWDMQGSNLRPID